VVTFIAFYLSFLRAFGDGQIPEDSLKILNYWSFPGQIVGVAGMGWNTLLHFHQTGFDYAIAFLGACGCAVLVIGNIVEVTAAISAGRQRVGKAVAGMGDD
jgi:hypothetical protein